MPVDEPVHKGVAMTTYRQGWLDAIRFAMSCEYQYGIRLAKLHGKTDEQIFAEIGCYCKDPKEPAVADPGEGRPQEEIRRGPGRPRRG